MDGAAFLNLPSSSFSPIPVQSNEGGEEEQIVNSLLLTDMNGISVNDEGERRQKEMLEAALTLEERYRTLLPVDRKGAERDKKDSRQNSVRISTEPDGKSLDKQHEHYDSGESEFDPEPPAEVTREATEKLKLRIRVPRQVLSSPGKSSCPPLLIIASLTCG